VPTEYHDTFYCQRCENETLHLFVDGHERDSSDHVRTCMICKWYRTGHSDKYVPPAQDDGDPA
jgi:hypothetical protein